MSTVEEDSDTVTVETVNSVTLTQDTDGNLILHCPQNGRRTCWCRIVDFFEFLDFRSPLIPVTQIDRLGQDGRKWGFLFGSWINLNLYIYIFNMFVFLEFTVNLNFRSCSYFMNEYNLMSLQRWWLINCNILPFRYHVVPAVYVVH